MLSRTIRLTSGIKTIPFSQSFIRGLATAPPTQCRLSMMIKQDNQTIMEQCKTPEGKFWLSLYKDNLMINAMEKKNTDLMYFIYQTDKPNVTKMMEYIGTVGDLKAFSFIESKYELTNDHFKIMIDFACKNGKLDFIKQTKNDWSHDPVLLYYIHTKALEYNQMSIVQYIEPFVYEHGSKLFQFINTTFYMITNTAFSKGLVSGLNHFYRGYKLMTKNEFKNYTKWDDNHNIIYQVQVPYMEPDFKHWVSDSTVSVNKIIISEGYDLSDMKTMEILDLPPNWSLINRIANNSPQKENENQTKIESENKTESSTNNDSNFIGDFIIFPIVMITLLAIFIICWPISIFVILIIALLSVV
jgi:hypothetical protein